MRGRLVASLQPQLYLDKDENGNCYDQGYNDIGVVIAAKWRHYSGTSI